MREIRNGAGNWKTSKNISDCSRVYRDVMSPRGESGNWANRTDLKPQCAVVGAEDKGCQSLLSQSGMRKQSSASQWSCGQPEVQGLGEVSHAAPQSSGGVGEYQEVWGLNTWCWSTAKCLHQEHVKPGRGMLGEGNAVTNFTEMWRGSGRVLRESGKQAQSSTYFSETSEVMPGEGEFICH